MDNQKLRFEIGELRKNIDYLSQKLENTYKDHAELMKNNDYETSQKGQINEELHKVRTAYQRLYEEKEYESMNLNNEIKKVKKEL